MDPIVELRGVSRAHVGPPSVLALAPLDLEVGRGEHLAITGPSGAGKSTLLQLIGLLDVPSTGQVRIAGTEVDGRRPRQVDALRARHVGFVFQRFHLLGRRTARENVELGLLYRRVAPVPRARLAERALEQVGLAHRADACAAALSGGEQQRVAIARAVVCEPDLLICDEPSGNLDQASSAQVLDLLHHLHGQGTTVVVATHDPAVAARCDSGIRLVDGEVCPP